MRILLAGLLSFIFVASAFAQIGQWDFNGNLLSATGGEPLAAGAAAPASTPGVTFATLIINGQNAQVAAFTRGTYFRMTHGLAPNGGGSTVNQYTLIMDVMFPNTALSGWAALLQTNLANGNDGDWFIQAANHGIGISGNYGGNVADGVWHRLALVVDLAAGTTTSFVNGQQVQQNAGQSPDGRFALDPAALLFADENGENSAGYVNSVQVRGYAMSAAELQQLGAPAGGGIPIPQKPVGLRVSSPNGGERWQAGTTQTISWTAQASGGGVTIELLHGPSLYETIGVAPMNAGSFAWAIRPHLPDSPQYRLRLRSTLFDEVLDESDGPFEVYGSVPREPVITKLPMLQDYRTDAMTLLWETDYDSPAHAVDWGKSDTSEHTSTEVITTRIDASHFVHVATIRPLETETRYLYRVRSGATSSPVFSFRSGPRRATPVRTAWFADEQGYAIFRRQVPHIAARRPDLVLVSGDLLPSGGSLADWQDYWFGSLEVAHLAQNVPVLFSRGNHDGEHPYAYTYSALPGNESWYAFTYGNVRFIFLNSNLPTSSTPQQLDWLKAELASRDARTAQFRVVSFHMPPYTDLWDSPNYSGEAWIRSDWVPLFEQHKVDVVVNGHTHAYLRGERNGVMYLIVGGAGNVLDTVRSADWGIFDVIASIHHYGLVEVDRNTLVWTTYDVNDAFFDSFTLASRTPLAPGDFDADGDVDNVDAGLFGPCIGGSGNLPATGCRGHDLDSDNDVDQSDFGLFQRCLAGPSITPDLRCADNPRPAQSP